MVHLSLAPNYRLEPTKIEGTVCIPDPIAAVRTGVYHPSVKLQVNLAQNDRENDWEMQDRRQFPKSF
eukprot:COSAG02_NODE_15227_length_1192_cov_1.489478_1_plen_66_part_10